MRYWKILRDYNQQGCQIFKIKLKRREKQVYLSQEEQKIWADMGNNIKKATMN